jgi:hypothetical protein
MSENGFAHNEKDQLAHLVSAVFPHDVHYCLMTNSIEFNYACIA